ncbi:MAG: response regulator [Chloroflexi bacterium]|nr:response regulator [Chloroflexota bacterium]
MKSRESRLSWAGLSPIIAGMEPREFSALVEEALAHLHDQTVLQTHPLARYLVPETTGEARGRALRRALLAAIQELRPSEDVPYESLAWRKYRYIYLRFVEAMSAPEIAEELAISVRQSGRYWREGVEAVASIIRDRCVVPKPPASRNADVLPGLGEPPGAGDRSLPEREATRMGATTEPSTTDLREVVLSALETIGPLAERRGQRLVADVLAGLPFVLVERTVLRQAILSLLSLSLEAAEKDNAAGPVVLRATSVSDAVEIELALTRSGESGRVRADYPSPEQLDQDTRWRIARHLLEAQGGTLQARRLGEDGLAMLVVVPTARPTTLLVVEDNRDTIHLFRRYLSGTPYRVVAATSAEEAFHLIQKERPAVITLDVMMPAQDGWEVLQKLKLQPQTRDIPVIVCSVLEERPLALLLGAAELLAKPISRQRLLAALAAALGPPASDRREGN